MYNFKNYVFIYFEFKNNKNNLQMIFLPVMPKSGRCCFKKIETFYFYSNCLKTPGNSSKVKVQYLGFNILELPIGWTSNRLYFQ